MAYRALLLAAAVCLAVATEVIPLEGEVLLQDAPKEVSAVLPETKADKAATATKSLAAKMKKQLVAADTPENSEDSESSKKNEVDSVPSKHNQAKKGLRQAFQTKSKATRRDLHAQIKRMKRRAVRRHRRTRANARRKRARRKKRKKKAALDVANLSIEQLEELDNMLRARIKKDDNVVKGMHNAAIKKMDVKELEASDAKLNKALDKIQGKIKGQQPSATLAANQASSLHHPNTTAAHEDAAKDTAATHDTSAKEQPAAASSPQAQAKQREDELSEGTRTLQKDEAVEQREGAAAH